MAERISKLEFERIIADPASAYGVPEKVLVDERLTKAQKIAVLKQWAFDAKELQVAEEENMRGNSKPTLLHQVLVVLHKVENNGSY